MSELTKFLVNAKKHSYASGNKAIKHDDGFEEFEYEEGEWKYRDRYHAKGPRPFGGEEVVWHKGEAVWMMNYYAWGISEDMDSEAVYGFLRKAMSLVSEERPFRGPSEFIEKDFKYLDESEGNVARFKGTERIFFRGKEVYRLYYHGGAV